MTPLDFPEFLDLKAEVERHQRRCGYYIIKLVDILELRSAGKGDEEIADSVFQFFDDKQWPPAAERPTDQTWEDYVVERSIAREHTIAALVGGPSIGHLEATLSETMAENYFDRFDTLFDQPKRYYIGMGFGDRRYVFLYGVAIIAYARAGVFWIVESD